MNRTKFIERVAKIARERYGQDFPESLFDDLVEDGLIPEAVRKENVGKRPVYEFRCGSYRRALQIARLRSKGIIGRDAIRLQLFLRGYSQPVWDVREALCKEYIVGAKSLSNRIRSGYVDNWKSVPPKHKASLIRQTGTLDQRFEAAGLKVSDDQIVEIVRAAKQKPIGPIPKITRAQVDEWRRNKPPLRELLESFMPPFSGALMFNGDPQDGTEEINDIEKLIRSAGDPFFLSARRLLLLMLRSRFSPFWEVVGGKASPQQQNDASDAATLASLNDPAFVALTLVQCLRFVLENPALAEALSTDDTSNKLLNMLINLDESTIFESG